MGPVSIALPHIPVTRARKGAIAGCVLFAIALAYLRDPAWAATMTSGMSPWGEDTPGVPCRLTIGRASFFIPADASTMVLPMRAVFPGKNGQPTVVSVSVDGRWLADVALPDPAAWVKTTLPLPRKRTWRRFRRVDLHVNRTEVGAFVVGVMTGEVQLLH